MRSLLWTAALAAVVPAAFAWAALPEQIKIDAGVVVGTTGASPEIRVFKGIPFAAPPKPQPVPNRARLQALESYFAWRRSQEPAQK